MNHLPIFKSIVVKYLVTLFFYVLSNQLSVFAQNPVLEDDWLFGPTTSPAIFVNEAADEVYLQREVYSNSPNAANTAHGALIDKTSGMSDLDYDLANSTVQHVEPDGSGGWYIQGYFSSVGDSTRDHLAHLNSEGHVTAWNPDITGSVSQIHFWDGILYVSGSFEEVNGEVRNNAASFNVATGELTSWAPNINDVVYAFKFTEDKMYVGGNFTEINGELRERLASFVLSTGELTGWNPGANGSISGIEKKGDVIFASGAFTQSGGASRGRLAAYDANTGALLPWTCNANNNVSSIQLKGDTLFAGGLFDYINSQTNDYCVAINTANGQLYNWNPQLNNRVSKLDLVNDTLYISGSFSSISGLNRQAFCALNANTLSLFDLNPKPDGSINDFEVSDAGIYVAGSFDWIGYIENNGFLTLDKTTHFAKAWSPDVNDDIEQIVQHNGVIYMCGSFTTIDGETRTSLAAFNAETRELTDWNPLIGGDVNCMIFQNDQLFIAGSFLTCDGESRSRLASFNLSTGELTDWNPVSNGDISAMVHNGNLIYIAGDFSFVGGQSRGNVAQIDAASGEVTSWLSNANNEVTSIALGGSMLYIYGFFDMLNGLPHNKLAKINATSGQVSTWSPNVISSDGKLVYYGDNVYISGVYQVDGVLFHNLAEIDVHTALASDWHPLTSPSSVSNMVVSDNKLYISGFLHGPGLNKNWAVYSPLCNIPTTPTFENSEMTICPGTTVSLNVGEGNLNDGTSWEWYSGSCAGEEIASGAEIEVSPTATTAYYVRGEGGCVESADCASITVIVAPDSENPTITIPNDLVVNADIGSCGASAVNLGEAIADDNCQVISVTNDAPDIFELGETDVLWTVTDGNGNTATATQIVTVVDAQLPELVDCPGDMTVTSNEPNCEATVIWDAPTSLDNCTSDPMLSANFESGIIFPFGNTEVVYTATDAAGNTNTCAFNIEVVSDIVSATESTDLSCYGSNDGAIDLNLSGGVGEYQISWQGPGDYTSNANAIEELEPGSYSASISIENGCTTTIDVEIEEPNELAVEYTSNDIQTGSNGSIDITVTGGSSPYDYAWTGPEGFESTNQDIMDLTVAGVYNVTVTDANGCESEQEIMLDSTVGLSTVDSPDFRVYPNPSEGLIYIEVPSQFIGQELYVTNILGLRIFEEHISDKKLNLNLEKYASGVYFIHIGYDREPVKVVKE